MAELGVKYLWGRVTENKEQVGVFLAVKGGYMSLEIFWVL